MFFVSNNKQARDYTLLDRAVVTLSAPVQYAVVGLLDWVGACWHSYVALRGVQADNDALRAREASLRQGAVSCAEMRHENDRLRLLVGLRERAPGVRSLAAEIIAAAPTPLFRSVRLDRGARDGVTLGAAVITDEGVVGRVAAVSEYWSDVMLLVDANSSIDVLVQRTRARARVRGQGGDDSMDIDVQYLSRTADVVPGDVLITSGLGRDFPKGLRIGRLTAVERRAFGLYQRAAVQPSVDFARLETVLVVQRGFDPAATFEAPDAGAEGSGTPLPALPGEAPGAETGPPAFAVEPAE